MPLKPKKILVIYVNAEPLEVTRKTIIHHLHALEYSDIKHEFVYYNAVKSASDWEHSGGNPRRMPEELRNRVFDAVILHYTFLDFRTTDLFFYKWKRQFDWIRKIDALKIAIPQDEGDYAEVLDEWLYEVGISIIFSVHYKEEGPLYPIMRNEADIYACLPGYIDEDTAEAVKGKLQPIAKRKTDIAYRARQLPYWFGKAGRIKYHIADVVGERARELGFKVDISTRIEDTILSNEWLNFLASSKAVIGTQGGYSMINWRGEVKAQIQTMLQKSPALSFHEVDARMPQGWDDYRLFTVTPRHFEAIITKTCQVLVEGEYKGVLDADTHYMELKQDFSNLNGILDRLRDHAYMQNLVDRAYKDIYLSGKYTYRAFAEMIDKVLTEHLEKQQAAVEMNQDHKPEDNALAVLERQLIAERHQHAFLYAMLPDLADQIASALGRRLKARLKRLLPVLSLMVLATLAAIMFFGN